MQTKFGFELIDERFVNELNTQARLWRHCQTGAELLSLENDDENNVFGIVFRTPPADSTGIAHIMEHSVLCGSEKYPVKEPFVELMKGSLNTFLNAFTYPDKTCYPVASTNLQDFYNLIDVYLDAVLHPLITPYTLAQEGWHYELDTPDGEMTYKGVVFNEMKGAYSSADEVLGDQGRRALYPDTIYSLDSGGDPEVIPDLTFDQFMSFHNAYYHPSNARIYFYGDDDPDTRLRLMDETLQNYRKLTIKADIPFQSRFSEPKFHQAYYDSGDDPEAKAQVCLNWLLPEAGDVTLTLGLSILSHILIGTPASPLRKALIDSGLGEDLTGQGFEADYQQMMFSVGLKGMSAENQQQVQSLILDTLSSLVKDRIDPETVQASMNTVEFQLRENNTGAFPRGLVLMLRSMNSWLYGFDPIAPLAFEKPLQVIKSHLVSGEGYFEALINQHLLENPHRVTVLLQPDPELGKRRAEAEQERLAHARKGMSPEQIQDIVATTLELKRRQEIPDSPEALARIPMLKRSDLERQIKTIPTQEIDHDHTKILFHDLFTNGILYLDLGFNLHSLKSEWLPYLPVFSRALLETGTAQLNFVQLLQRIGQRTGGIRPTTFTSAVRGSLQGQAWLFLRGKAMANQTQDLLAILKDVLFTARLDDRERVRQIILENKAGLESGLVTMGHRVINTRLKARFNEADWATEEMNGVSQLFFLRRLLKDVDENWATVQSVLESIRTALFTQSNAMCNITLDAENWQKISKPVTGFIGELPESVSSPVTWLTAEYPSIEGLTLPAQVNYVGKGANLYAHGYQLHGSALAIIPYLRGTYLWEKVRVMGGAYGGMNAFDQQSGALTFLSYRDPNLDQTLIVYDQAADYLRNLDLSENELTKAIIGAIGEVDAYQLPDAKGYTALLRYLLGISDEERQQRRDELLNTTPADFHAFAESLEQVKNHGEVVVLGSSEAIQASQVARKENFSLQRVM
jgi:presequence protease